MHNLAGAAGTFGYPALSSAAIAIDDCYAEGAPPSAGLFAALERELVAVVDPV